MSCTTLAAIGLHLATWHAQDNSRYQNVNPGVYVRTECGLGAGVYRNSFNKASAYVSWSADIKDTPLFVSVGAVTGYRIKPVSPLGMVGLRANVAGATFRLGFVPKIARANRTHLFHLMVERKF